MTIIIAAKAGRDVIMGADSQITCDNLQRKSKMSKIFKNGNFLLGVSGHPKCQQLLKYYWPPPEFEECDSEETYLYKEIPKSIRDLFKKEGYSEINNNTEEFFDTIIFGYNSRIFSIESNYQVMEFTDSYICIGSGRDFAYGSLYSTWNSKLATDSIKEALKAAANYCIYCNSDFNISVLESKKEE
jgi:ATP-dependent protease HslVU (ClpYQ) peptidase subunit